MRVGKTRFEDNLWPREKEVITKWLSPMKRSDKRGQGLGDVVSAEERLTIIPVYAAISNSSLPIVADKVAVPGRLTTKAVPAATGFPTARFSVGIVTAVLSSSGTAGTQLE